MRFTKILLATTLMIWGGTSSMAQYDFNAHDLTTFTHGNLVNHSTTEVTYKDGNKGLIAAGNVIDNNNRINTVFHVLRYKPDLSSPGAITIDYQNPEIYTIELSNRLGKVVSITPFDNDKQICVTLAIDHFDGALWPYIYVFLDAHDYTRPITVNGSQVVSMPDKRLVPFSTVEFQGKLVTCGFAQEENTIGDSKLPEIDWTVPRETFISVCDPINTSIAITLRNSPPEFIGWFTGGPFTGTSFLPNLFAGYATDNIDMDFAVRLKEINGELYVMGCSNGSSDTYGIPPGPPPPPILPPYDRTSSGVAWNAKIEILPGSNHINVINEAYFKQNYAVTPSSTTVKGVYSIDMAIDPKTPNQYYNLFKLNDHTSGIAHLESNLDISGPNLMDENVLGYGARVLIGSSIDLNMDNKLVIHGIEDHIGAFVPVTNILDLDYTTSPNDFIFNYAQHVAYNNKSFVNDADMWPFRTSNFSNMYFCPQDHNKIATVNNYSGSNILGIFTSSTTGFAYPRVINTDQNGTAYCTGADYDLNAETRWFKQRHIPFTPQFSPTYQQYNIYGESVSNSIIDWPYVNDNCSSSGLYYRKMAEGIVSANESKIDIKINPNPVQEILTIEYLLAENNYKWTIYDFLGRAIKTGECSQNAPTVSVHELPHGTYILELTVDHQKTQKKFLKQ